MTRRVFISYQHADQMKARGLNLMTYNKNVNVDFTGRHLLDPVKKPGRGIHQPKDQGADQRVIGDNRSHREGDLPK